MPLFEVTEEGLIPFQQVPPGEELYEDEIEELVWGDLEAFLGETLFPIARQAQLTGGGRVDVLALDESGRVVVIEIKRDVDRS
jgi:RecB family endonuclease NucS